MTGALKKNGNSFVPLTPASQQRPPPNSTPIPLNKIPFNASEMNGKPLESSAKRIRTSQGNNNDETSRPRQRATPRHVYGQPTNPMNHIPEHLMQFSEAMGQLQGGRRTPHNVQRGPEDYTMSGGLPTPNTSKIPNTMPPHIGKG
jgi:hypothetical protein